MPAHHTHKRLFLMIPNPVKYKRIIMKQTNFCWNKMKLERNTYTQHRTTNVNERQIMNIYKNFGFLVLILIKFVSNYGIYFSVCRYNNNFRLPRARLHSYTDTGSVAFAFQFKNESK